MQRHAFDPVSLIFGVFFTVTGVVFLVGPSGLEDRPGWLLGALPGVIGAALVSSAVSKIRRGSSSESAE